MIYSQIRELKVKQAQRKTNKDYKPFLLLNSSGTFRLIVFFKLADAVFKCERSLDLQFVVWQHLEVVVVDLHHLCSLRFAIDHERGFVRKGTKRSSHLLTFYFRFFQRNFYNLSTFAHVKPIKKTIVLRSIQILSISHRNVFKEFVIFLDPCTN